MKSLLDIERTIGNENEAKQSGFLINKLPETAKKLTASEMNL